MPRRPARWGKRGLVAFIVLIVLLAAVRIALPSLIERYVNRTINRLPDYSGRIEDLSLSLLRGAYSIERLSILKRNRRVPVPLLSAEHIEFSVQWKALLRRSWVGEVYARNMVLNIVNARTAEQQQTRVDPEWLQVAKDLFPLTLNHFKLEDSQIHFRDFQSSPQVDLFLSHLSIEGHNFSNVTRQRGLVAVISADGTAQEAARISSTVELDPTSKLPYFRIAATLTELPLIKLNSLLRAYGGFDAEGGTIAVSTEIAAEQNKLRGYLKPIVTDAKFVSWEEDKAKPLKLVWEGLVGFLEEVLENRSTNNFGARVPLEGSLESPETDILSTLGSILKNAFVKALKPGLEGSVKLGEEESD